MNLFKNSSWLNCFLLMIMGVTSVIIPVSANEPVSSNKPIHYHVARRLHDPQIDYYVAVLQQVCIHSEPKFGVCDLQPVVTSMPQSRQLVSLSNGILSVMWTVTTSEREEKYLPVRIPLTMGLIGARISVHNENQQAVFQKNTALSKIKSLSLVQGHDWPDLTILQHNNFNVAGINWNSSVYRMLSKGVADHIFRSILEVNLEVKQQSHDVIIDKNHLFYYPSALYFFVSKNNQKLHERLTFGLQKMVDNGKLKEMLMLEFEPHNLHEMLYEQSREIHYLENPILPKETPIHNKKLWLINL